MMSYIVGYVVIFLISWTVLGVIFTLLIWPLINKRLNQNYPVIHSSDNDNL